MPLYKFECDECGETFTEIQDLDAPHPECPGCGSDQVDKMMGSASLRFKGEGFYRNDYGTSLEGEDENTKG